MIKTEKEIAALLLQIKAIKLDTSNTFTWASGWKSPIYCDNRKVLSFPALRVLIVDSFVDLAGKHYAETEVIAGVATGAIAFGALVAEKMGLPLVYVRTAPKAHGLGNQVEGELIKGQKTLVIEDLVSTGQSSLNAVEALRNAGAKVTGMLAVFTYGFEVAERNFQNADCRLITLSNYFSLIEMAADSGYIREDELKTLREWRDNPSAWKQQGSL